MITEKEAREAARKIKNYCWQNEDCRSCIFHTSECALYEVNVPAHWYIKPDAPSDMERAFAKKVLERDYDTVNVDYDADGRHVLIYKKELPQHYEILRADSFPSLQHAGIYPLRDMIEDNR